MLNRLTNPPRRPKALRTFLTVPAGLALALGLLLPLPLLSLAGCQDGRRPEGDPRVNVGTLELRRDTRIGEPIRSRDEFNLLHVAVPVHNVTDKQLYVQGLMTFYDHSGNQVGVPIHRTITIPAQQSERFEGNCTTPQAESFRLALNYPRVQDD